MTTAWRKSGNAQGPRSQLVFRERVPAGYGPIGHLSLLAARLLDLELVHPQAPANPKLSALRRALFRAPFGADSGVIYIASNAHWIRTLAAQEDFYKPKRFRAIWIIDSFLTEGVPSAWMMRHFDLLIYMQRGEADFYERLAPGRTLYLPWGADVLDLGSSAAERPVDVLRVGRQPDAWDDDARSEEACEAAGLRFSGRPPYLPEDPSDPSAGHRHLSTYYARAKFVLAHSNLAAPAPYTHPTKEYITGRWTDALAGGAVVAGVHPYGDATAADLLWPGATLDFDRIDLAHNIEALREAVACWTPDQARRNHLQALGQLDWRWRLQTLAEALDLTSPALDAELSRLRAAMEAET